MTIEPKARYPGSSWGVLGTHPCSPLPEPVATPAWDVAVEDARRKRMASQRARESLVRLQSGKDAGRAEPPQGALQSGRSV